MWFAHSPKTEPQPGVTHRPASCSQTQASTIQWPIATRHDALRLFITLQYPPAQAPAAKFNQSITEGRGYHFPTYGA